jgi:hypothetical protein
MDKISTYLKSSAHDKDDFWPHGNLYKSGKYNYVYVLILPVDKVYVRSKLTFIIC